MQHIEAALRHLGSSAPGLIGIENGKVNSPQPASDAIMREAKANLETIRNPLATGTAAGRGNAQHHRRRHS